MQSSTATRKPDTGHGVAGAAGKTIAEPGIKIRGARVATAASFGVLGWLMVRSGGHGPLAAGLFITLAAALGMLGRFSYILLLVAFNPAVRHRQGYAAVRQGVDAGFLMLIPFTVLAVLAEVGLGWSALLAFASAGIMLAGTVAGADLSKLQKQRWLGALLPSLGAGVLAAAWMVLLSLAQSILQAR